MRTSEDNPHDWFLLAADRLRITDLAYQHEGVTFSGVELLQEAVERHLKGYLVAQRWQLERTHDLGRLIEAAGHFDARFSGYTVLAEKLTDRYWDQRYYGARDYSGDVEDETKRATSATGTLNL